MTQQPEATRRAPLNRDRVLRAAVALADDIGIEALSMRKLAQELGVVPMALYKHVANKEQLLDGMVEIVVGEIDPPAAGSDWKSAVRRRVLSARRALLGHAWASQVIQSRTHPAAAVLEYMDSVIGMFRLGGFSLDLTHHAMHAMGSRVLGFTQELFDDSPSLDPQVQEVAFREMAEKYPYVTELAKSVAHDGKTVVGQGCDDQFEFEFALDLLLDGFDRLRQQGWTSAGH
ncbi:MULTISPECIES: TetR/AcrR family transcriptional regulator C-terminal domain-containing protein [unclassified Streptomyces]|uniref:TetR/AcrR family transcriptional regulator C-terminal domain-containing protein n=1 Tax=unclassified Streptomyces TaxID=2593676 RepID=UPI001BEC8528|nr:MULTISPECIES: TetR/AcrR family transcriptional regulator C-terminal domain-containing protein [unclassified Streptomyces]MBT2406588.1 TetR/AcrR family transcriptional regulator C-terminal domain-containing protein [Streptomyces sp. ISL-21]MBT2608926.1 TetR/AcrR family transcriptional regulator C-terminal domain-containing protein [Streptomyces sp. ISL-87]